MKAPIAVFAYNRPAHTKRLLESAKANPEFADSPIHIYCDGAKHPEHAASVAETRRAVREHAPEHAEIVERPENYGLAKSIIAGVTDLCDAYGRAIVLEDDLVLTPFALGYLNSALDRYADEDRVMHAAAYMFPVRERLPASAFFYREATCWGWATWRRAWKHFNPNAADLLEEIDRRGIRAEFDVRNSMFFYQMLKKQRNGEIDSWAIRWYASMRLRDGLALHPPQSLVENLGFDGSGVHCNVDKRFEVAVARKPVGRFPDKVAESEQAVRAMIDYRQQGKIHSGGVRGRLKRLLERFA
jgi:hypothetical protein